MSPVVSQKDALLDVEQRFLVGLPPDEIADPVRLFFHIEQAWWFYEDKLATDIPTVPHIRKFPAFSYALFHASSLLKPLRSEHSSMLKAFHVYRAHIPTYGVLLLTRDLKKVLMVTSYHNKNSWGFPKGKINQGEDPLKCAAREVYEEVGYDCAHLLEEDRFVDWTERKSGKYIKLYIAEGADEHFEYKPTVEMEIGLIRWFTIRGLPKSRQEKHGDHKFWGVAPFINDLNTYVSKQLAQRKKRAKNAKKRNQRDDVCDGDLLVRTPFTIDRELVMLEMSRFL